MAFRSIEEFEQILRETPPAARYLELKWSTASTHADWMAIRSRMLGAEWATLHIAPADAADYALLRDIAAMHAENVPPVTVYNILQKVAA